MTCSVAAQVTEWPKEFQVFLPGSTEVRQAGRLTVGRAEGQPADDPAMVELARAALRGHVEAYPDADTVFLSAQEHRDQVEPYAWCFARLDEKYGLSSVRSLDATLALAARPGGAPSVDLAAVSAQDRAPNRPASVSNDKPARRETGRTPTCLARPT
jgi:hypothetical protein